MKKQVSACCEADVELKHFSKFDTIRKICSKCNKICFSKIIEFENISSISSYNTEEGKQNINRLLEQITRTKRQAELIQNQRKEEMYGFLVGKGTDK
jgi:hypothetical protein